DTHRAADLGSRWAANVSTGFASPRRVDPEATDEPHGACGRVHIVAHLATAKGACHAEVAGSRPVAPVLEVPAKPAVALSQQARKRRPESIVCCPRQETG